MDQDESVPQKVRKRTDRSEKLKERKLFQETVVKSTLRKYVCGEHKEAFIGAIQKRVASYSKALNIASISLMGLVKELFHETKDVADVEIPDIFDPTFVRQLILGPGEAKKPYKEVVDFYENHPELFSPPERFVGDANIYCYGAMMYITNLRNSIVMNFEKRIKKYLKQQQDILKFSNDERVMTYFAIMGWKVPITLKTKELKNPVLLKIVEEQRGILGLQDNAKVDQTWIKGQKAQKNILKQWVHFNRFYETHRLKKFSIVPISSIRSKFITIDTSVLYGIMKELGMVGAKTNQATFESLKDAQWRSVFRLDKHEKRLRNKEFTNTVNTDGISLCVHFRQRKSEKEPQEMCFDEQSDRILACDPGRVNIYTLVEKIPGSEQLFKSYTLTRSKYYNDSGVFKARKITECWNKSVKTELEALSQVSLKGALLKDHEAYVKVYLETKEALWDEYSKNRWGRQRLRLYGAKKRTFSRFFDAIKDAGDPEKPIAVFYGSAKFVPCSKNEIAVPTTRAYKECSSRFPTKPICEFRTSKIDYETDQLLQGVESEKWYSKNQNNTVRSRRPKLPKANGDDDSLRGLLWCGSTIDKTSKFVDRDINAAKNIYRCGVLPERPEILSRSPTNEKLEWTVGKLIRTLMF